jgi:biofilm PGA synthesis N-glycosyltransferase PgaC
MNPDSYVLVTAAYNEARFIEQTIRSVISQTIRPQEWIIVSDGSDDATDEIVKMYSVQNTFIQLRRITEEHPRNFKAQVNAINFGISQLKATEYNFLGNLDADVTFEPQYFALLLAEFENNPNLGLAGGAICEQSSNGIFKPRRANSLTSVAHACQFFRRECFEAIGGAYLPLPYGGPDTYAETSARMKCWSVQSFPNLKVFHHRPTGSVGGVLRGWFRQGKMDYSLGAHPVFELFKLLRRISVRPYVIGSVVRLIGFIDSYCHREQRAVPDDFVIYLRQEQKRRLTDLFLSNLG